MCAPACLFGRGIFFLFFLSPESIENMIQAHDWIGQDHSWANGSHDILHHFSLVGSITVDGTFSACCLFFLKRAIVQPFFGIVE